MVGRRRKPINSYFKRKLDTVASKTALKKSVKTAESRLKRLKQKA